MRTTIDTGGRVVIPKALRDRLGLSGGQTVEVREWEGRIEIEPAATPISLKRRGKGLVAVPKEALTTLTDEMVRATSNGSGDDRARNEWGPRLPAHAALEGFSVLTRLPPPHCAPPPIAAAFLEARFSGAVAHAARRREPAVPQLFPVLLFARSGT